MQRIGSMHVFIYTVLFHVIKFRAIPVGFPYRAALHNLPSALPSMWFLFLSKKKNKKQGFGALGPSFGRKYSCLTSYPIIRPEEMIHQQTFSEDGWTRLSLCHYSCCNFCRKKDLQAVKVVLTYHVLLWVISRYNSDLDVSKGFKLTYCFTPFDHF